MAKTTIQMYRTTTPLGSSDTRRAMVIDNDGRIDSYIDVHPYDDHREGWDPDSGDYVNRWERENDADADLQERGFRKTIRLVNYA